MKSIKTHTQPKIPWAALQKKPIGSKRPLLFLIKGPIRQAAKLKEKEIEGHNNSNLPADLKILYNWSNIRDNSTS